MNKNLPNLRFIVAHPGARMHYAIPRIFLAAGCLEMVYTDICATKGWLSILRVFPLGIWPKPVKQLLARDINNVPSQKITAFNFYGLECQLRLRMARSSEAYMRVCLWAGRTFCQKVLSQEFGRANALYTFNSSGLELLNAAKRNGLLAIMEQTIAPKRLERQLMNEESGVFSEWEESNEAGGPVSEFIEREEAEWRAADVIVCGSEFVRDGIRQCGGPVEKCMIVPYGVDVPKRMANDRRKVEGGKRPLRVLTIGAVGLRKGSPYVLEAAKRLKGKAEFRMVGTIGVKSKVEAQLREHLELTGPVPRNEVAKHFDWADVFLLPSICEGSATVTYEALNYGLPVICTPNTGSMVRDGVEGFIVPIRDVDLIVNRIDGFIANPGLREQFSIKAEIRSCEYTVQEYGRRLLEAIMEPPDKWRSVSDGNHIIGSI